MSQEDPQELICPRCRRPATGRRCPRDGAYLVTREALAEAGRDAYLGELVAERYAVVERLGVGGMGSVYRAIDEHTGQVVALKFLLEQYANHPSIRVRFIREAEAAAAVTNPYVVGLLDFGVEADKTLWIAMEYVKGWTLRDEVNHNGPFTVEQCVRLARQALDGLAAAHEAGLVHRDLKHDNIMFCGNRQDFVARILDFGVVKSAAADAERARNAGPLTAAGVLVGSPSYMSPEQIRGLEVGPPADLYGLGVVLYEVLTARRLFSVNDYETLLRAGARRDAPPLRYTASGEVIPKALDHIIQRTLAIDPKDRFPDATTMRLALDQMESHRDLAPDDLLSDSPVKPVPLEPIDEAPEQEGADLVLEPSCALADMRSAVPEDTLVVRVTDDALMSVVVERDPVQDDAEAAVSALLAERVAAGPVVVSSRPAEEPPPEERLTLLPPAPPPPASRVRPAAVFLGWAAFGWLLMFGLSCLR